MITLMSAKIVVLSMVGSDLRSIVTLTDKFIPDSDSVADIFISKDDSVDECHDGCFYMC